MNRNVIEFPTENNSLYEIQHSNWNTESHVKYLSFIIKEPNCVLYGAKESFGSVCVVHKKITGYLKISYFRSHEVKNVAYSIAVRHHFLITQRPEHTGLKSGLILGLCSANERRRYFVTTSHTGLAQTLNQPYRW